MLCTPLRARLRSVILPLGASPRPGAASDSGLRLRSVQNGTIASAHGRGRGRGRGLVSLAPIRAASLRTGSGLGPAGGASDSVCGRPCGCWLSQHDPDEGRDEEDARAEKAAREETARWPEVGRRKRAALPGPPARPKPAGPPSRPRGERELLQPPTLRSCPGIAPPDPRAPGRAGRASAEGDPGSRRVKRRRELGVRNSATA